jgi:VanZ family protein
MSSNRRGAKFWISAWLPVAVGVVIIALESTEYLGSNYTSGPLRWLYQLLAGPVGDLQWNQIHHYIRKSGHFLGYGAIGLAWLRAWRMTLPQFRFLADTLLAMLGTSLLASWDEWHQSFLPNRTSSPWDVLLDCSGALVMVGIAYLVSRRLRHGSPIQHS